MKIEDTKSQYGDYFAAIENGKEIGEAAYYTDNDGDIVITHIGIEPAFRGGGNARELMMGVVEHCRAQGKKITPVCSYARTTFQRHPEIHDVLKK